MQNFDARTVPQKAALHVRVPDKFHALFRVIERPLGFGGHQKAFVIIVSGKATSTV
jgi:hypothetical protein